MVSSAEICLTSSSAASTPWTKTGAAGTGQDPDTALAAARSAVESVGGFITSADRKAGLGGERRTWRYIYEIWMVPENLSDIRVA
jgi:hypothetical protein